MATRSSGVRYGRLIKAFLYLHCDDLEAARRFYSDLLGLDEIYHSIVDRSLGYRVGDLQLSIASHPEATPAGGWSKQMGWQGGDRPTPSLGVEFDSDDFRRVVRSLRESGVSAWSDEPLWVGYWSFPVRDPMGHTVEVSCSDEESWTP